MLSSIFRRRRPIRIGYALGGGAVRGAAHLGALAVLREAGIEPDFIAGTSAGAIVGAGYAAGVPLEDMSRQIRTASRQDIATLAWRRRGLSVLDTTPLSLWIEHAIGDVDFAELSIPLAVVACNVIDGREVVLREGSVVRAAVASSAIPGLFTPVEDGPLLLVDGGMVNNLPVNVARAMGADVVIAVDVNPVGPLAHRPSSLLDMVTASLEIAAGVTQRASREAANVLVQPDVARFSLWDFANAEEIEAAGRRAAEEALNAIRHALE